MNKTALCIGGGLDSWAVALTMANLGIEFDLVWVDYGQACAIHEHTACEKLSVEIQKKLVVLKTDRIKDINKNCLLFGNGEDPIVKLRNLEIIQTTAGEGYKCIFLALLNERSVMFPDANEEFIRNARALYTKAYDIVIDAPFILNDKWDFVVDVEHRFPFLDKVFTCWQNVSGGCGTCAHCEKLRNIKEYYKEKYV